MERLGDYSAQFVLIGGTACDLAMSEAGLAFRATKDLDIVLCVEALSSHFVKAFWEFVGAGGYTIQQRSSGRPRFYRFQKPTPGNPEYPWMLELFSRTPDGLTLVDGATLTPIPIDEEVSSLSAILVDDAYYDWIRLGRQLLHGVPILPPEHLIPLKAKAWLDLTARKLAGAPIDSRDVVKHKNDVFRLFQILERESSDNVPERIQADLSQFLKAVATEGANLKQLGLRDANLEEVLNHLRQFYRLPA